MASLLDRFNALSVQLEIAETAGLDSQAVHKNLIERITNNRLLSTQFQDQIFGDYAEQSRKLKKDNKVVYINHFVSEPDLARLRLQFPKLDPVVSDIAPCHQHAYASAADKLMQYTVFGMLSPNKMVRDVGGSRVKALRSSLAYMSVMAPIMDSTDLYRRTRDVAMWEERLAQIKNGKDTAERQRLLACADSISRNSCTCRLQDCKHPAEIYTLFNVAFDIEPKVLWDAMIRNNVSECFIVHTECDELILGQDIGYCKRGHFSAKIHYPGQALGNIKEGKVTFTFHNPDEQSGVLGGRDNQYTHDLNIVKKWLLLPSSFHHKGHTFTGEVRFCAAGLVLWHFMRDPSIVPVRNTRIIPFHNIGKHTVIAEIPFSIGDEFKAANHQYLVFPADKYKDTFNHLLKQIEGKNINPEELLERAYSHAVQNASHISVRGNVIKLPATTYEPAQLALVATAMALETHEVQKRVFSKALSGIRAAEEGRNMSLISKMAYTTIKGSLIYQSVRSAWQRMRVRTNLRVNVLTDKIRVYNDYIIGKDRIHSWLGEMRKGDFADKVGPNVDVPRGLKPLEGKKIEEVNVTKLDRNYVFASEVNSALASRLERLEPDYYVRVAMEVMSNIGLSQTVMKTYVNEEHALEDVKIYLWEIKGKKPSEMTKKEDYDYRACVSGVTNLSLRMRAVRDEVHQFYTRQRYGANRNVSHMTLLEIAKCDGRIEGYKTVYEPSSGTFLQVDKGKILSIPEGATHVVLHEDLRFFHPMEILKRLETHVYYEFFPGETVVVNGVPGGHKSQTITECYRDDPVKGTDMVTTATSNAVKVLKEKLVQKKNAPPAVRTVDSAILNEVGQYSRLLCDEGFMVHYGLHVMVAQIVKAPMIVVFGDRKQIPFISFVGDYKPLYSLPPDGCRTYNLSISSRVPQGVAKLFFAQYPEGFYTTSDIPNGVRVERNPSVMTAVRALAKTHHLITYTQADKDDIARDLPDAEVNTAHEVQGETFKNTALVRLHPTDFSLYKLDVDGEFAPWTLVAMTRATNEAVYITPEANDGVADLMETRLAAKLDVKKTKEDLQAGVASVVKMLTNDDVIEPANKLDAPVEYKKGNRRDDQSGIYVIGDVNRKRYEQFAWKDKTVICAPTTVASNSRSNLRTILHSLLKQKVGRIYYSDLTDADAANVKALGEKHGVRIERLKCEWFDVTDKTRRADWAGRHETDNVILRGKVSTELMEYLDEKFNALPGAVVAPQSDLPPVLFRNADSFDQVAIPIAGLRSDGFALDLRHVKTTKDLPLNFKGPRWFVIDNSVGPGKFDVVRKCEMSGNVLYLLNASTGQVAESCVTVRETTAVVVAAYAPEDWRQSDAELTLGPYGMIPMEKLNEKSVSDYLGSLDEDVKTVHVLGGENDAIRVATVVTNATGLMRKADEEPKAWRIWVRCYVTDDLPAHVPKQPEDMKYAYQESYPMNQCWLASSINAAMRFHQTGQLNWFDANESRDITSLSRTLHAVIEKHGSKADADYGFPYPSVAQCPLPLLEFIAAQVGMRIDTYQGFQPGRMQVCYQGRFDDDLRATANARGHYSFYDGYRGYLGFMPESVTVSYVFNPPQPVGGAEQSEEEETSDEESEDEVDSEIETSDDISDTTTATEAEATVREKDERCYVKAVAEVIRPWQNRVIRKEYAYDSTMFLQENAYINGKRVVQTNDGDIALHYCASAKHWKRLVNRRKDKMRFIARLRNGVKFGPKTESSIYDDKSKWTNKPIEGEERFRVRTMRAPEHELIDQICVQMKEWLPNVSDENLRLLGSVVLFNIYMSGQKLQEVDSGAVKSIATRCVNRIYRQNASEEVPWYMLQDAMVDKAIGDWKIDMTTALHEKALMAIPGWTDPIYRHTVFSLDMMRTQHRGGDAAVIQVPLLVVSPTRKRLYQLMRLLSAKGSIFIKSATTESIMQLESLVRTSISDKGLRIKSGLPWALKREEYLRVEERRNGAKQKIHKRMVDTAKVGRIGAPVFVQEDDEVQITGVAGEKLLRQAERRNYIRGVQKFTAGMWLYPGEPIRPINDSYKPDGSSLQAAIHAIVPDVDEYPEDPATMAEDGDKDYTFVEMELDGSKTAYTKKRFQPIYRPKLRSTRQPRRENSQFETLIAVSKRNLEPNRLQFPGNEDLFVDLVTQIVLDRHGVDDWRERVNVYRENPLVLSKELFRSWLRTQDGTKMGALAHKGLRDLSDIPADLCDTTIKRDQKPAVERKTLTQLSKAQVILASQADLTAYFSPIFRAIFERFKSLLGPHIMINTGYTKDDVEAFLNYYARDEPYDTMELDFSSFDKTQQQRAHTIKMKVYSMLGLSGDLLEYWEKNHEQTVNIAIKAGIKFLTEYQHKSGDATTTLGNCIIAFFATAYVLIALLVAFMFILGDDNLMQIAGPKLTAMDALQFGWMFNIEAKLVESNDAGYFCGSFLVPGPQGIRFIGDPVKRIDKLATFSVTEEKLFEEQRQSLLDATDRMENSGYNETLSAMVASRYKVNHNFEPAINALYNIARNKFAFRRLFRRVRDWNKTDAVEVMKDVEVRKIGTEWSYAKPGATEQRRVRNEGDALEALAQGYIVMVEKEQADTFRGLFRYCKNKSPLIVRTIGSSNGTYDEEIIDGNYVKLTDQEEALLRAAGGAVVKVENRIIYRGVKSAKAARKVLRKVRETSRRIRIVGDKTLWKKAVVDEWVNVEREVDIEQVYRLLPWIDGDDY